MDFNIIPVIFLLGLIVGSFLNVCIYRIPKNETVVFGGSYCPVCKKNLGLLDLIPLISFLILKGHCRYCNSKIYSRYFLVEGLTGIVFVITYLYFGSGLLLIKYLLVFSVLIIISFIDIDHRIIPNQLVFILFAWFFLWQLIYPEISFLEAGLGALLGGGFFLLVAILSRGGMGGGDIKLMFSAGFFLGMPLTALAIFISSFVGGLLGIILMAFKIKGRKDVIPFGPFLAFGVIMASLWGEEIIRMYLELFMLHSNVPFIIQHFTSL